MKKQIRISDQILAGNLGDSWKDNNDAADALAEFMSASWLEELSEYDGYEIDIDIDVQHDAEGSCRDLCVDCDDMEVAREIEESLTDSNDLWERFCDTDQAARLSVDS